MKSQFMLSWWVSAGSRGQLLRASIGAICAIALTVAVCGLGESAREALETELLGEGQLVRARPPRLAVGPLDLVGTLIPEKKLDEQALSDLQALGPVAAAWPESWSRFAVRFRGNIAGRPLYTEGALLGLLPDALGDEAPEDWNWSPGERVPILAPKSLLVAYNRGFAPANDLPRLTEKAAIGLQLTLVGLGSDGQRTRLPAEVVGTVHYGGELAGIVPLAVVTHLEEQLGAAVEGTYSSALVQGRVGTPPTDLMDSIRSLGWGVEEVGGAIRQLSLALSAINLVVRLAGGILACAALLLLAQVHSMLLRQRSRDFQVLRTLGISTSHLASLLAVEVAVAAGSAVILGIILGRSLASLMTQAANQRVSEALGVDLNLSASLPPDLLPWLLLGGPLLAILASIPAIKQSVSGPPLQD
ncbi:MAG: ABC transporter permease [Myxococcota bacterium]|nr:ABC transporter permease [Myxococcota bacterium]